MALNPYQHWLGLDSEDIHPHYFQLLGVSSQPANEEQYRLVVAATVKERLTQLDQAEIGPHVEPMRLLRERIVRAGKTLVDPQRRESYLRRLRTESGAPVAEAGSVVPPAHEATVVTQAGSAKSDPTNPSLFPPTSAPPSNPPSNLPSNSTPNTSANPPVAVPTAVPTARPAMAVPSHAPPANYLPPVATPVANRPPAVAQAVAAGIPTAQVQTENIPTAHVPTSAPATAPVSPPAAAAQFPSPVTSHPIPNSFEPADTSGPAGLEPVRPKPVRRRRRSMSGIVIAGVMLAVAAISLIVLFLVLSQSNQSPQISEQDARSDASDTSARQRTIPKPSPAVGGSTSNRPHERQQDRPQRPRNDSRNSNNSLPPTPTATGTLADIPLPTAGSGGSPANNGNNPTDTDQASSTDEQTDFKNIDNPIGMPSPERGLPPLPPDFENDNMEMKPEPGESEVTTPTAPTRELSDSERINITRNFRLIRRSLQRRDAGAAAMLIMATQLELDTLAGDGALTASQQQRLQTHFQSLQHTKQQLEGFWGQVKSSCRPLVTGQEIKIGQQILGFVEANPDGVYIRNAGSNIFYGYEFMPPGIAMTLAKMGTIEDIPTWRLQLAAFYSMYAEDNPDYEKKIDDLISQSEADGHDGTLLREYLNTDFSDLGEATAKQAVPPATEIKTLLQDFSEKHGELDPKRARPNEAEMLAKTLLSEVPEDSKTRIAYLQQARELAIRSGNAYLLEDIVLELELLARIDTATLFIDSMLGLSKQKLSEEQARDLMETAIPFLKSPAAAGVASSKKLVMQLAKIAQQAGFVDSQRRLSQM